MSDPKEEYERILADVDTADAQLVDALDARARAVSKLVELRQRATDHYFGLPRDVDVMARATERRKDFPRKALQPVMREVLSACASLVAPLEVVYAGAEGGLGHTAAYSHFGAAADVRAQARAEDVIGEVERKRASLGLIPWESSNDGAITTSLNLLSGSEVKICGEIGVPGSYHLLSRTGENEHVRRIYGTPTAIAAAQGFLHAHFPQAQVIDTLTGFAAAELAEQDDEVAAIGTDVVLHMTDLELVQRSIEDRHDLRIRYAIVGNEFPARTGSDRTAVALALHDAPGALFACLRPLADRDINMSRLETRPAYDLPWRYLILVELDGHITDRQVLAAVEEMRGANRYVRVLGSYPQPE